MTRLTLGVLGLLSASCQIVSGLNEYDLRAAGSGPATVGGGGGAGGAAGGGGRGGAACEAPAGPVLLASALNMPRDIVVDDTDIYWAEAGFASGEGRIWRLRKEPCAEPELLVEHQVFPEMLALSSHDLFWSTSNAKGWKIWRLDRETGAAAVFVVDQIEPFGDIDAEETELYWSLPKQGLIRRVDLVAGTSEETLLHDTVGVTRLDIRDPDYVFASTEVSLLRVPRTAPVPEVLYPGFPGESYIWDLTTDDGSVFFTEAIFGGTVRARGKAIDDTKLTNLAVKQLTSVKIAADRSTDDVYWTSMGACNEPTTGGVMRGKKTDPTATEIMVEGQHCPWGLAVDEAWIYWTDSWSGEVWKLHR